MTCLNFDGRLRVRWNGDSVCQQVLGQPRKRSFNSSHCVRERVVNRYRHLNILAAATALALVTTGASAAGRADLHREDMARVKQNNAAIAASGAARMVHSRHEQALGLDAELMRRTRGCR